MNSNRFFENGVALAMFALLAAFLCSHAKADDTNPNAPTPVTEWVYQGASFADMLTTIDIAKHPNQYYEINPILGKHPSVGLVVGYFSTTHVLHYLITREMVRENVPAPIVQTWEALGIGLEVGLVAHNYQIGLRAQW
jgi:hypothetical protein